MAKKEEKTFTLTDISWWQWLVIIWFFAGMGVLHFGTSINNSVIWTNGIYMIMESCIVFVLFLFKLAGEGIE